MIDADQYQAIDGPIANLLGKEKLSREEADKLFALVTEIPTGDEWDDYFDEVVKQACESFVAAGLDELAVKLRIFASF